MPQPFAVRRWITSLACWAGGLGGTATVARTLPDMIGPAPSWVWAASLFLLLLALVGALVLAALRTCWPTQSVHRKQLLESLLSRRSTP